MAADPSELTAGEAAAAVRNGGLSPLDLVDAALARIAALDGTIEAFCFLDRENARRAAAKREREAARGDIRGPLHGVPFAAKDIFTTRGIPTEAGSAVLAGHVPDYDATAITRLKQAGAILLGKTHTTEFANTDPAPTRNPWNLDHTPGGSSSGSAAAVAARMTALALGTQTGGSILRPAAYCGVVGFKPSFGRVSLHGVLPLTWCMDHVGFITRSVGDAAVALAVTAGADPRDSSAARLPVPRLDIPQAPTAPTIGRVRDAFFEEADHEVLAAVEAATKLFSDAGAAIREVRLPPSFAAIYAAQHVAEEVEMAEVHAEHYAARAALYRPKMREAVELGFLVPSELYVRAQRIRRQFRAEMVETLGLLDALLLPTIAAPAPAGLASVGDWRFQSPWSSAGLPSISLPTGLSRAGLPLAIQLIGAPFGEPPLLAAASWCESRLGRLPPPPLSAR
jgi:Asp-tRNA(Asn)/Glu-tRNA(Gln) amidotransferase A subunit family amidase